MPEFPHQVYEDVVVDDSEDDGVLDAVTDESGEEEEEERETMGRQRGVEEYTITTPRYPKLLETMLPKRCYQIPQLIDHTLELHTF